VNALRIDGVTRPLACGTAHDSATATDTPGDSPDSRLGPGSAPAGAGPNRMRPMLVVVLLERDELPLEISRGPEQHPIQTFAPYGPNQPFDDRMGARHVRHRLDFSDVEDPQVRLPLMKPIQPIMVRTEVGWQGLAGRRVIEHPAQRHSVQGTTVHPETDDATCPVVHHHEHPIRVEDGRFAPK
jgi:hypothetical protein